MADEKKSKETTEAVTPLGVTAPETAARAANDPAAATAAAAAVTAKPEAAAPAAAAPVTPGAEVLAAAAPTTATVEPAAAASATPAAATSAVAAAGTAAPGPTTPAAAPAERQPFSILENLTKTAAVLGAFVAVGQTGSEIARGYWQREIDAAKAKQELQLARLKENSKLAEDYLRLIISKDITQPFQVMLLGALSEVSDHPLQKWAKARHTETVKNIESLKQAHEAEIRAADEKNESERLSRTLEAEIQTINVQINLNREDVGQITDLQQRRRLKAADLGKVRAASVKTAELTALIAKIDKSLLLAVFSASAGPNIDRHLPFLRSALQEFQISDRRTVAAILATIAVETPLFEPREELLVGAEAEEADRRVGNSQPGDGVKFRGRGYLQVKDRLAYAKMSNRLGLGNALIDSPIDANSPEIAARILCASFADFQPSLQQALDRGDTAAVRLTITRSLGLLQEFTNAYTVFLARL